MTVFNPCLGCISRNGCDIKAGIAKAMRGLPISKATIRCDLPFTRDFPPGTRVVTVVYDHTYREYDGSVAPSEAFATVIKRSTGKRGKLLLHLDEPIRSGSGKDDAEDIKYSTAYPKDLQKVEGPLRILCDTCHVPMVDGETCENKECWGERR